MKSLPLFPFVALLTLALFAYEHGAEIAERLTIHLTQIEIATQPGQGTPKGQR